MAHFCKGTYYVPVLHPPLVRTLGYPTPEPGAAGLGTHLTLDLGGNLRFGPTCAWSTIRPTWPPPTYLPAIGLLTVFLPNLPGSGGRKRP